MKNKEIPLWLCGLSFYEKNQYKIYTLCLEEYKKIKSHSECSLKELKFLIMHEFVHICHQKYTNNTKLPIWMSEGLATTLSHQCDTMKKTFNATLDQIINGGIDYKNYYVMFSYILNNYGKKYILDLLKNEEQLKKITPKLYKEVSIHYNKKI